MFYQIIYFVSFFVFYGSLKFSGNHKQFLGSYIAGNTLDRMGQALGKLLISFAQRLAHTVKGVSGNIGARELFVVAGELEDAIKHEKTDEIVGLIEHFSKELHEVLDSLKGFIELEGESEKVEGEMADQNKLLELLLKLEPHVKTRKPKLCKEVMIEISAFSWPEEYSTGVVDLKKMVGKYKFKEARGVLEGMIKDLR
jgi:two-component system sensor histidine kinase/response regulator